MEVLPGVAAAHLPHLFERFHRAPEARDAPGSGPGLSIVAQVVDPHGGRVETSAVDRGGTVVTMQLPPAPTDG